MRILGILAVWLLTTSVLYGKMPYDAVCKVEGKSCNGSGTLVASIDGKGLILSEAHCYPKETEVKVTWPCGKSRTAKPIYVSYAYDTALLVVDNPPVEAVKIALSLGPKEAVYLVGYPWYSRDKLHYQSGTIERLYYATIFAETTCRPAPAMSGGAVFNSRGSLCGSVKAVQGDGTGGVIVTNAIILPVIMSHADPETWVPITHHLRPNQKFKYAEREKEIRTEEYDESTAPDLEPIETKVPAEK